MRKLITLLLCLMAAVAGAAAPALAAEPRAKKVLVIGLDGVRVDALKQGDTPVLDRLIRGGAFAESAPIHGERYQGSDTVSGASWSSILTGVWADKHRVDDNKIAAPNFDAYPHFFSYVKAFDPEAQTISLVSWAPIEEHIVSGADIHRVVTAPEPDSEDVNAVLAMEDQRDGIMAEAAEELLKTEDPAAMFVYFHQADGTGHTVGYGPQIPQYVRAIENVDAHIGHVLEAVRSRASYEREDWLILVTTDHGGVGKGHGGGHGNPLVDNSFLIASGPSVAPGRAIDEAAIVDVVPTALRHLGIPLGEELDGQPQKLR